MTRFQSQSQKSVCYIILYLLFIIRALYVTQFQMDKHSDPERLCVVHVNSPMWEWNPRLSTVPTVPVNELGNLLHRIK